jgi:hypothetical protein
MKLSKVGDWLAEQEYNPNTLNEIKRLRRMP